MIMLCLFEGPKGRTRGRGGEALRDTEGTQQTRSDSEKRGRDPSSSAVWRIILTKTVLLFTGSRFERKAQVVFNTGNALNWPAKGGGRGGEGVRISETQNQLVHCICCTPGMRKGGGTRRTSAEYNITGQSALP